MKNNVFFIKLGQGSEWANECIEKGTIRIGFRDIENKFFLPFDYREIWNEFKRLKYSSGSSTLYSNQIKNFWEADEDTVWLTFYNQKMWWCRAQKEVFFDVDNTKYRKIIASWSDKDVNGNILWMDNLSGRLLKVQGFQSTICIPDGALYAHNRIHGVRSNEIVEFEKDYQKLSSSIVGMIQNLIPDDFEVLLDLIFRNAGFQRLGIIGKQQKTIDISLLHPVLNERVFVQSKGEASLQVYLDWKRNCLGKDFTRFYFVVHSPNSDLAYFIENDKKFTLWREKEVAEAVINNGLMKWLVQKVG